MENCLLICCYDSILIATRFECYKLSCKNEKYSPDFDVYYHKINNEYSYCLNRKQLGQYWQSVIKDRDIFCPERCEKFNISKEMTDIFTELQVSFFIPNKVLQTILIKFHINQFCGVYLIV